MDTDTDTDAHLKRDPDPAALQLRQLLTPLIHRLDEGPQAAWSTNSFPISDMQSFKSSIDTLASQLARSVSTRTSLGASPQNRFIWVDLSGALVFLRNRVFCSFGLTGEKGLDCEDASVAWLCVMTTTSMFMVVRNLCAGVKQNQAKASGHGLHITGEEILMYLSSWLVATPEGCEKLKAQVLSCIHMGIQMIANMMTGNPDVLDQMWPHFMRNSELFKHLLQCCDTKVAKFVGLTVHNAIYSDHDRSRMLTATPAGRCLLRKSLQRVLGSLDDNGDGELFEIIFAIFRNLMTLNLTAEVMEAVSLRGILEPRAAASPCLPASTIPSYQQPPPCADKARASSSTTSSSLSTSPNLSATTASSPPPKSPHSSPILIPEHITFLRMLESNLEAAATSASSKSSSNKPDEKGPALYDDGEAEIRNILTPSVLSYLVSVLRIIVGLPAKTRMVDGVAGPSAGATTSWSWMQFSSSGSSQPGITIPVQSTTGTITAPPTGTRVAAELRIGGAAGGEVDADGVMIILQILGRVTAAAWMSVEEKVLLAKCGLTEALLRLLEVVSSLQPRATAASSLSMSSLSSASSTSTSSNLPCAAPPPRTLFMLKSDAVRIIANMCYGPNTYVQDEVRELGGLGTVLSQANLDDLNPFMREYAIFAIRNLCDGNPENKRIISSLEAKGFAPATKRVLEEMGVEAELRARATNGGEAEGQGKDRITLRRVE
ncbi:Ataxin-10 [Quaeritorhiza haematococci]|nr:Ataxin-10 [Quaeritorhiza haematococci]